MYVLVSWKFRDFMEDYIVHFWREKYCNKQNIKLTIHILGCLTFSLSLYEKCTLHRLFSSLPTENVQIAHCPFNTSTYCFFFLLFEKGENISTRTHHKHFKKILILGLAIVRWGHRIFDRKVFFCVSEIVL